MVTFILQFYLILIIENTYAVQNVPLIYLKIYIFHIFLLKKSLFSDFTVESSLF